MSFAFPKLHASLLAVLGCTAAPPALPADGAGTQRATAHPEASITLARPVRWSEAMMMREDRHDYYLAPGTYRAVLDDARGTFYTGPSPCLVTSIVTPEGKHFNGQDWLCGLYVPTNGAREARVQSVYAGWWQQLAFLADGSPDLDHIGLALAGAPVAGTDPFLAIKNAPRPASAAGASEAGSPVSAGGIVGAIPLAIFAAMDSARRGYFEDVKAQPPAGWLATAGGVAPSATEPASAASPASPSAEAIPRARAPRPRPEHARHLDPARLDGQVWTFPHPSHPERFGNVRLVFANGQVEASNAKSQAAGPYAVQDDLLCIEFDAAAWGHTCYYVVDDPGSPRSPPSVLAAGTGRSSPLTMSLPNGGQGVIVVTSTTPPAPASAPAAR